MHWASLVHAPRQSLPEQPIAHVIETTGAQAPAPSQPAARVTALPLQLCTRQLVAADG
jgi:hypothetical protein